MTKISTLAFSTLFFFLLCSNMALAQSTGAPPKTNSQSAAQALRDIQKTWKLRADKEIREFEQLKQEQKLAAENLRKLELLESKSGISGESFSEIVKNLQAKRIDLLVDIAGLEAKRDTILEANKTNSDDAAIVEPLEKIIEIKQAKLEQTRKKLASSSASIDEIRSAEMSLLSSKVQLAGIKSKKDSSNLLSDALLDTSLALSESKARLAKTESLLQEVLPARKELERRTRLKEQAPRLLKAQKTIEDRILSLTREIENVERQLKDMESSGSGL